MENSILILIIVCLVSIAIGYVISNALAQRKTKEQQLKLDTMIQKAQEEARTVELQAKDNALKVMQSAEAENARRRNELSREDDRLQKRRAELDHRFERLEQREQNLNKRQSALDKRASDVEKMYVQQLAELQRIAEMTSEEARNALLGEVEKEARSDMARIIRQIENEAREEGESRARQLIADAIQRVASDHVA